MAPGIQHFFDDYIDRPRRQGQDELCLKLAGAALLEEVVHSERVREELELDQIHWVLGRAFRLPREQMCRIIDLAAEEVRRQEPPYGFSDLIRCRFKPHQKIRMAELLWEAVAFDGRVDRFEEDLLRKAAHLIALSGRDLDAARRRALKTVLD